MDSAGSYIGGVEGDGKGLAQFAGLLSRGMC